MTTTITPRTATHRGLSLTAVCLGYLMVIMDATAVNLSLPALGRDLGGGLDVLQWVVDGYTLTFAAFLLSAGALGDRLGSRDVFVGGLVLFIVASVVCGCSVSAGMLIAARLVQGLGAAILVPSSLALLQAGNPDKAARARAVGIWGGVAGIAAASGPIVGGALTQGVSWRAVFFINVPIGLVALLLTVKQVIRPRGHGRRGFDPLAQGCAVAGLAVLTLALIEARTAGWIAAPVLGLFAAAAAFAIAFVLVERRAAEPMLPLALFADKAFAGGTAIGLLINLGFYGQLFVTSLYLQNTRHLGATAAGLALLPEGLCVSAASFLSGRLTGRAGPRPTLLIGLAIGAAGLAGMMIARGSTPYLLLVAPLAATGFGMAFTMPAATTTVVEAAPSERAGVASGTINTGRQMGSTLGVALMGTLAAGSGMAVAMAAGAAAFGLGALIAARTAP
jgi:DHA2 family methylenomycin A resistance protein-like MFS transporter